MRAIWTGSISFGLINIPVRLYSAAESRDGIDLHMLHKKDNSPIRFARICREDGQEVPYEDIVKGFEYRKGDYVVIDEDDFKQVDPEKRRMIDIAEFIDEKEIDIRYFEKPYYLEPDKGAAKSYVLLRDALAKSGKLALAKFVMRNREHIAAVKPVGKILVLDQLRYTSEIRGISELNVPDEVKAEKREIDMALALIESLSEPFIPEDFHDEYTEELEKAIDAKVKGKKPAKTTSKSRPDSETKDLMAALKASLEKQKTSK